jgi:hypothetical protein
MGDGIIFLPNAEPEAGRQQLVEAERAANEMRIQLLIDTIRNIHFYHPLFSLIPFPHTL